MYRVFGQFTRIVEVGNVGNGCSQVSLSNDRQGAFGVAGKKSKIIRIQYIFTKDKHKQMIMTLTFGHFWLIWHKFQTACVIMNCLSCAFMVVVQCCGLWTILLATGLIVQLTMLNSSPAKFITMLNSYKSHFCNCTPLTPYVNYVYM